MARPTEVGRVTRVSCAMQMWADGFGFQCFTLVRRHRLAARIKVADVLFQLYIFVSNEQPAAGPITTKTAL